MKVDTLSVDELDQMMSLELVCQWCESPAEYMWRHGDVVHFNCGDCAEENMELVEEMIFEGANTGWCVTCKVQIDIIPITFYKI